MSSLFSNFIKSLQDYLIEKWYKNIMETLWRGPNECYNVQGVFLWQMETFFKANK